MKCHQVFIPQEAFENLSAHKHILDLLISINREMRDKKLSRELCVRERASEGTSDRRGRREFCSVNNDIYNYRYLQLLINLLLDRSAHFRRVDSHYFVLFKLV